MKLIVGLGNPGRKYAGTRHNVGFDVVDRIAARWSVDMTTERFDGQFGLGEIAHERAALLKPLTFMNRSGRSVQAAGRFYKLELSDLLVIVDDHALPLGRLRIRMKGSSGGHNGLQDIVDRLGSMEWCRMRIGVDEPIGDPVSYVLGRFHESEQPVLEAVMDQAVEAAACWVTEGPELAMTRFNGTDSSE